MSLSVRINLRRNEAGKEVQWMLSGGHVEEYLGESDEETAQRETLQEVGVHVDVH
jgi:ADP-ribose pyrophosphatase YjhB (NUDIX family)